MAQLRDAITKSEVPDAQKMNLVADIDTIQSQLAKPEPNLGIVKAAWETVKGASAINGCVAFVAKVSGLIAGLL